eukprot:CAMPEP_0204216826 /NCGR_PEP_ID=MMETSP0361-20130328/78466_1 /ASSEMBLY_ACC=CAM_ASM_000343 /TAXON_ID=268821 /ORGANISM="Scrippsiella Hangoei, Strain SHTV-5" /LENGTH=278 /DNA_ID=CAMNT_0051181747 /DNA_START=16 /DNA_END=850 /DNA_ORIENTATION=+
MEIIKTTTSPSPSSATELAQQKQTLLSKLHGHDRQREGPLLEFAAVLAIGSEKREQEAEAGDVAEGTGRQSKSAHHLAISSRLQRRIRHPHLPTGRIEVALPLGATAAEEAAAALDQRHLPRGTSPGTPHIEHQGAARPQRLGKGVRIGGLEAHRGKAAAPSSRDLALKDRALGCRSHLALRPAAHHGVVHHGGSQPQARIAPEVVQQAASCVAFGRRLAIISSDGSRGFSSADSIQRPPQRPSSGIRIGQAAALTQSVLQHGPRKGPQVEASREQFA